jgi:amino acid adenylation domain-containing protein
MGIIAHSESRVDAVNLVSPSQIQRMHQWNIEATGHANGTEYNEACIRAVFEYQATLNPELTAITAHDGRLTYGQLDQLATRLARHLVVLGVTTKSFIPYCFSKSMWTVVAILGILKAGGAGVPLDPKHPWERMETILQDTNANIVVTSPLHKELFQHTAISVVTLNTPFLQRLPDIKAVPCPTVRPDNAAFVIFTSGSTGVPKGVVLEHHSMATNCQAYGKRLGINDKSRVLQFAAHTFDASIFDMCAALLLGGRVCIPSEHERMNDLVGFINRNSYNWILATSTVMNTIAPQQVPTLKVLVLGGEPLTRRMIDVWEPFVDIDNAYGPTEAAIISACNGPLSRGSMASCIGQGVTGSVWLTVPCDHTKLVPTGCIGEITVQGPGVSRGYLNSPTKTSEVFIDSPQWLNTGIGPYSRVYRTGDLGRLNPDGTIECLGRKDNQVKLRGQRLELGEIEYHIARHHQVKQSIVIKGSRGLCRERPSGPSCTEFRCGILKPVPLPPKLSPTVNAIH